MDTFYSISKLLIIFVYFAEALEFDAAFEKGEFEEIKGSQLYLLDPDSFPAISLYYDQSRTKSVHNTSSIPSINLTFKTENLHDDPDFLVGISLVFLKFTSTKSEAIVHISKTISLDTIFMGEKVIEGNFGLPNASIEERHIVTTWEDFDFSLVEEFRQLEMRVSLSNWDESNQLYLTATSYKIKRSASEVSECQGFSFKRPKWWNCNTNEDSSGLLCLNYQLTCDGLPHCAKQEIPNPDENCGYHVGLREALQLLIYSVLTIFLVLFVAGCAKCCLRGFCQARQGGRRPSDILEILSAESSQRPDNSPPTYEDAMKYVNDAFEDSEQEEEQEPPPTYSPVPKEGEFVFNNSPLSERGAVGGSPATVGPPPSCCSCDKSSIIRPRPRSRSPRPTTGTTLINTNTTTTSTSPFDDNFDNQAVASLPKDPPPYLEHDKEE